MISKCGESRILSINKLYCVIPNITGCDKYKDSSVSPCSVCSSEKKLTKTTKYCVGIINNCKIYVD